MPSSMTRVILACFLSWIVWAAFAQVPAPMVPNTLQQVGPQGVQGPQGNQGNTGPAGINGISGWQQVTTNSSGTAVWSYTTNGGAACSGASLFWAQAQVPAGAASVNVWNVGAPTSTTQTFQISLQVVVSVVGINVLQLSTTPGATTLNVFCK